MEKRRRRFSAEEKAEIIKRHLVKGDQVSEICEDLGVVPNQFYRWQKEFFDNAAAAFLKNGKRENSRVRKLEEKVRNLQDRISHKDSVIAEITEDYVKLKKNFGEI